jgi:transposase
MLFTVGMDRHTDSHFAGRLTVVETGRRRRWSDEEKLRIVEESLAGHRQASATARRHGIPTSLLFKWRRDLLGDPARRAGPGPAFIPVAVAPDAPASVGGEHIEVVLPDGRRVVVGPGFDAAALARVLAVLEGR